MSLLYIAPERLYAGDTDFRVWELLDENGDAYNLSRVTVSVTMYLQKLGSAVAPVEKALLLGQPQSGETAFPDSGDGTDGKIQFLLDTDDTDHAGEVWKRWIRYQDTGTNPNTDFTYASGILRFLNPLLDS